MDLEYTWGPFDGLQDVGIVLGYGPEAPEFGPYWAGFDLGDAYTVTSIVVWNGDLFEADLWAGETLTPDPDLYADNLIAQFVRFPRTSQNDVGFTDPDRVACVASRIPLPHVDITGRDD